MEEPSLYVLAKQLERELAAMLSLIDPYELDARPRELVLLLKTQVIDVRLDARDYDYAETKADQQTYRMDVRSRLETLRQSLLAASEYGIFSPVEIVHFSTRLDGLLDVLQ